MHISYPGMLIELQKQYEESEVLAVSQLIKPKGQHNVSMNFHVKF